MCKTGINTVTMVNINPEAILERQLAGGSASQNPQIVSCDSLTVRIRFFPKIKLKNMLGFY